MPARGNNDVILQSLRAAIASLESGRRGQRGGRQGGKGSQKGRQGRQREAAKGDWRCNGCGAFPVYADRTTCFKCGKAKCRGGAKGEGMFGQADACPTHRVPGSSVAASGCMLGVGGAAPLQANSKFSPPVGSNSLAWGKGAAKGTARSSHTSPSAGKGPPPPAAAAKPSAMAASGGKGSANLISSPATPKQASPSPVSAPSSPPVGATPPRGSSNSTSAGRRRPPWADTFDDDDDTEVADAEDEGDDGGGAVERCEDVNELRKAYLGACAFLRSLKKGSGASGEVIELATRERDEAEERWRAAKPPTRVSVRLARASASLDKAFRAKEAADEALADFDARAAAQRSRLLEDQARARERIALHQAKVDDLRAESGAISGHTPKPVLAACRAARVVGAGLGAQSVPRLQAALETLECTGADQSVCGELNLLLNEMVSYEYICRKGYDEDDGGYTECFDIGDHDGGDLVSEHGEDAMADVHDDQSASATGGERRGNPARPGAGEREQHTRWARQQGGNWKKARLDEEDAGGDAGGSSSGTAPPPEAPGAGATAATAARAVSQTGGEVTGREAVAATPGELQALVQERQNSGDWEATRTLLAQQEAMAAEQRRLHRAHELAEAARNNGIRLDPAAFSWSLLDLESWAKENGMQ